MNINPCKRSPVLLEGKLYYLMTFPIGMVSFSILEEEFKPVLPSPPPELVNEKKVKLTVLRGCLALVDSSSTRGDVWILKDMMVWVKEYTIHMKSPHKHLNVEVPWPLMVLKKERGLGTYDRRNGGFHEMLMESETPLCLFPFVENLNSLKEDCCDGKGRERHGKPLLLSRQGSTETQNKK
ncbi:hypothetical protein QJS10_CPB22g00951 [Acorus calamus]|uniref:F-box associated domain-containing protein n=1 Tax=Acorus calamus TaxID=4465 RepID=A0AAV9C175_ACOCL|nr:hypothetical protein QJS10_CPB22g00951 [Acorus calamus]